LTRKVHAETRRHSLRRSGSSSQPLSCDLPDQARDDLAFRLFGRFQNLELLGRQMTLDRLGALPPPQRKDLRGLALARD